jgi:hypothetical protein
MRDAKSGYRQAPELRDVYSEDYALQCDQIFAKLLNKRALVIAEVGYIMGLPSRDAAVYLRKTEEDQWEGTSPDQYRVMLDELVARVDGALALGGISPPYELDP